MSLKNYIPGDIVIGKVIKLEADCAYIDLGLKSLAYIHISEMWNRPNYKIKFSQDILYLNQIRDFVIIRDVYHPDTISLSIRKINHKIIVKRLQQIYAENVTIYTPVIKVVKAGALVDIEELLDCLTPFRLGFDLDSEDIEKPILPLKILNLIVHHAHVEDYLNFTLIHDCPKVRDRINKYKVGSVVTATVKIIKNNSVIVDIKNDEKIKLPGFIKKDEISSSTINNLNHIFKVGQEIKTIIIETNLSLPHFSLSTKALEEL